MDTKQIDYVLRLASSRSFTKAAAELFISQPTLTYQIKAVENEIGFTLFKRGTSGVTLTPAGEQFVLTLKDIRYQLNHAIENGQNFSSSYSDNLRIVMPVRSCLHLLPEVMKKFFLEYPHVNITPAFDLYHGLDSFLKTDQDIAFANEDDVRSLQDINVHPLYSSGFYFVCTDDDPYADRDIIHTEDIKGRTLMVNGGSGKVLRSIQQRILKETGCDFFNSNDHDTSLTYIAAKRAIVVAPGSLNDHSAMYRWIPFDCPEKLNYVLITHAYDHRPALNRLVELMQKAYTETELPL